MTNSSLVSLTNVGKKYQQLQALESVNLELTQGEVLGLFGHNGAGKTTMMKLILGIISPSAGQVKVLDVEPDSKLAGKMREQVGYLPENVSFYDQLTGLEVLTYFAKLKGYNKQHAISLLEQVGIDHAMKRAVKTYSKGMRQRLGLAQAFIGKPKLLLLDEPTVGLDPIATADFYQNVDQLKAQGTSVILCSHVLPGVEQHIDRAMIMSKGKTLAMGTIEQLRGGAQLPVTIKPSGLNGALESDSKLFPYKVEHSGEVFLSVPEPDKLTLLRHLLSYQLLENIVIEPANLAQIYQHYLSCHHQGQHHFTAKTEVGQLV